MCSINPATPVIDAPVQGQIFAVSNNVAAGGRADALVTIELELNGSLAATTSSDSNGAWSATLPTPLNLGANTLRARARLGAKLSGWSPNRTLYYDTVAPTTVINAPVANNQWLSSTYTFRGQTTDDNAGISLEYRLHTQPGWTGAGSTSQHSFTWSIPINTTSLTSGSTYTFYARGRDAAGRIESEKSRLFRVDNQKPAVSLLTASPQYTDTFSLSWSGNDAGHSGIATYTVKAQPANGSETTIYNGTGTSIPFTASSNVYTFSIQARDNAGNSSNWVTKVITLDLDTPVIEGVAPAGPTNNTAPDLSGQFNTGGGEAVNTGSLQLWLDGVAQNVSGATVTTSGFVSTTGTLTDGLHTVAASVANATGRGPTKSWEFFVDSQVPTVTLTAAPSGSTSLLVSWQGSDPAPSSGIQGYEVQYKVGDDPDWTPWLTNTTNTNATFQATLVQTYTFQVRAIDNAGNQSNWVQTGPVEAGAVTKYYLFGDQRVAMRQGSVVYYLNGDHLGSVSLTTDQSGNIVSEVRYLPYGEERWTDGASPTDFGFTSQRNEASFGLMDYNARYYDPFLGRFISPDTLVPEPGNPQAFNRYAYTLNNPVKFTDPSGHEVPNICLWCNKEIANTKNWSDLALSLAEVGCVAAGCHVDREANVIRGPTTEEFASTFGLDFINPLGFATVGAGRGLSRLGKETVGEVSKTILRKTQQGVSDVIQPHLDAITQLAPDAQVGFRGSLARGTKGPHKQNAPFDPTDFDIDAFIVSDELAARYSKNQWWRSGDAIPELKAIQDQIGMVLKEQFPGLRDEPFTFRIYTSDEFTRKVKPDEQFFIK